MQWILVDAKATPADKMAAFETGTLPMQKQMGTGNADMQNEGNVDACRTVQMRSFQVSRSPDQSTLQRNVSPVPSL